MTLDDLASGPWATKKDISEDVRIVTGSRIVTHDSAVAHGSAGQADTYILYVVMNPRTGEVYDYYEEWFESYSY